MPPIYFSLILDFYLILDFCLLLDFCVLLDVVNNNRQNNYLIIVYSLQSLIQSLSKSFVGLLKYGDRQYEIEHKLQDSNDLPDVTLVKRWFRAHRFIHTQPRQIFKMTSNLDEAVDSFWQLARHWNQGGKANNELSCENGNLHMQLSAVLDHPDQPNICEECRQSC